MFYFIHNKLLPYLFGRKKMELREFVKMSLVEIVQGIKEANKELSTDGVVTADNNVFMLKYSGGNKPEGSPVEFDVAISTTSDQKAGAGASAKLYVVDINVNGSQSTVKEHVSRVKFSVFVKMDVSF